jgi:hypothetical protein
LDILFDPIDQVSWNNVCWCCWCWISSLLWKNMIDCQHFQANSVALMLLYDHYRYLILGAGWFQWPTNFCL